MSTYRTCAVPMCGNTTIKYPDKLFIHVPKCPKRRKQWLQLARRDPKFTSDKSVIFFCEDHFDLPNDMENYTEYSLMGSVGKIRMKPDCLPLKFECQPDRIKRTAPPQPRSAVSKRQRMDVIQDIFSKDTEKPATSGMTSNSENVFMAARKNVRSTNRQIEMLVDYMSTHTLFANGEYNGPLGRQAHEEEWVRVQQLLQEYGPNKTVEQWRTTWRDLKKKARADGARANADRALPGNNNPISTLSETSLKILNIIGTDSFYSMADQDETSLGEIILVTQQPLAISPPPATSPPLATSLPPTLMPPTSPSTVTQDSTTKRGHSASDLRSVLIDIISNSLRERNGIVERKMRRRHLERLQRTRMEKNMHMGPKN